MAALPLIHPTSHSSPTGVEESVLGLIGLRHTSHPATPLETLLATVRGDDDSWVTTESLYTVTIRLLALASYNKEALGGQIIARYAKRLIAAELATGGPYAVPAGESSLLTHAAIEQLFILLGSPLPNVHLYVQSLLLSPTWNVPLLPNPWALFWPHELTTSHAIFEQARTQLSSTARSLVAQKQNSSELPPTKRPAKTIDFIEVEISQLPPLIQPIAKNSYSRIVSADKHHEIRSLTRLFTDSLIKPSDVNHQTIAALDKANVYIWIAYTHYDDFIDEEGTPALLPLANIFHRKAYAILLDFTRPDPKLLSLVTSYFDEMDAANLWEVLHCRCKIANGMITIHTIPRYGKGHMLARRAGLHGLGPVLSLLPNRTYSRHQLRLVRRFFSEYLIARQLNDDLHDWKKDLANGHISFVVAFLLRKARVVPGVYVVSDLTAILQKYFWKSGLIQLGALIISHTDRAMNSAISAQVFTVQSDFIAQTLQPIIDSTEAAMRTVRNKKEFLTQYKSAHN